MPISIDLITPSGQIVQAELDRMQPRHIEDFEIAWQEMLQNLNQYDAFWDWAMKKRLSSINRRFEAYAIEYNDLTLSDYGEDPAKDNLKYFEFGIMR